MTYMSYLELRKAIDEQRAREAEHDDSLPPGPPAEIILGPLSLALLNDAKWKQKDRYPAWQEYADELEGLLNFAKDEGVLERYFADLTGKLTQRDTFLDELRIAYVLTNNGYPVIKWKPSGFNSTEGEYLIDVAGPKVFVEVKSPQWKGELTTEELQAGRAKQPKHLYCDARAIAPWERVQFEIKKAYPKFDPVVPNLLIVSGNGLFTGFQYGTNDFANLALYTQRFVPGATDPAENNGFFLTKNYENLGGVGLFSTKLNLGDSKVTYVMTIFPNPNALIQLPVNLYESFPLRNDPPGGPNLWDIIDRRKPKAITDVSVD